MLADLFYNEYQRKSFKMKTSNTKFGSGGGNPEIVNKWINIFSHLSTFLKDNNYTKQLWNTFCWVYYMSKEIKAIFLFILLELSYYSMK